MTGGAADAEVTLFLDEGGLYVAGDVEGVEAVLEQLLSPAELEAHRRGATRVADTAAGAASVAAAAATAQEYLRLSPDSLAKVREFGAQATRPAPFAATSAERVDASPDSSHSSRSASARNRRLPCRPRPYHWRCAQRSRTSKQPSTRSTRRSPTPTAGGSPRHRRRCRHLPPPRADRSRHDRSTLDDARRSLRTQHQIDERLLTTCVERLAQVRKIDPLEVHRLRTIPDMEKASARALDEFERFADAARSPFPDLDREVRRPQLSETRAEVKRQALDAKDGVVHLTRAASQVTARSAQEASRQLRRRLGG